MVLVRQQITIVLAGIVARSRRNAALVDARRAPQPGKYLKNGRL